MRSVTKKRGKEYGIEDEAGNTLIWPHVTTKSAARDAAKRLAEKRGESVYLFEVGADRDGTRIVVDREEVALPLARSRHHAKKKSPAQLEKKSTPIDRWYAHVKATPPGMIPVLLDGHVPAWNVAPGPMKAIRAYYAKVAPKQKWPRWVMSGV